MAYSDCDLITPGIEPRVSEVNTKSLRETQENLVLDPPHQEVKAAVLDNDPTIATPCHKDILTPPSLLRYLRSIKEFELYYYLFNQVSIAIIENHKLETSREGADKSLNNRLAEILFTWTGTKWNVMITDTSDHLSLKEKIKARFMKSEEWQMLQEHSSGVTLTDIILD